VKTLIAAAVAVSALALAGTASAQVYGTIGYSYQDGDLVNLAGPTARVGWKSSTPFGVEAEGSIGTDKDTGAKAGPNAIRYHMQNQWAGYVTATGKVGETFEAMARIGYGSESIKATPAATYTGPPFVVSNDNFNSRNYGLAGQWVYDGVNGLRVDYTRFNYTDKGIKDFNVWSISWVHKFGVMGK
jgi:outer membrane immunogenic protein